MYFVICSEILFKSNLPNPAHTFGKKKKTVKQNKDFESFCLKFTLICYGLTEAKTKKKLQNGILCSNSLAAI